MRNLATGNINEEVLKSIREHWILPSASDDKLNGLLLIADKVNEVSQLNTIANSIASDPLPQQSLKNEIADLRAQLLEYLVQDPDNLTGMEVAEGISHIRPDCNETVPASLFSGCISRFGAPKKSLNRNMAGDQTPSGKLSSADTQKTKVKAKARAHPHMRSHLLRIVEGVHLGLDSPITEGGDGGCQLYWRIE
ncbi:hypothetical protein NPIL_140761 [Nephila pilipes]|uniref:Uncharacterized protein n=1 Tax=Nephila pilipes TaxID=299642 RepID=A0A8X6N0D2_NEPPI|nr:hypothetical protein NPIL_140761 [Nephila pilipes]